LSRKLICLWEVVWRRASSRRVMLFDMDQKCPFEGFSLCLTFFGVDRLPTKDNLLTRGIVDSESQLSSLDCGSLLSIYHIYFLFVRAFIWCGALCINGWGYKVLFRNVLFLMLIFSVAYKFSFLRLKIALKQLGWR
jgi:hypothetical protein